MCDTVASLAVAIVVLTVDRFLNLRLDSLQKRQTLQYRAEFRRFAEDIVQKLLLAMLVRMLLVLLHICCVFF
jgi:hypothetical protein